MSNLNCTSLKPDEGNQELDQPKQEEGVLPSFTKTMEDLPPELLTKILEFVTEEVDEQSPLLGYRLVNLLWKGILDSLIEKKILSAEFSNSPAINIGGAAVDFQVCLPPTRFSADGNPFPFNSLRLNQRDGLSGSNNVPERSNYPILSLPAFASRFGVNLTSLGLRDISRFPISSMAAMLSSMPSLERLRLEDVDSEDENIFPTIPPLPCLSTLELLSRTLSDKINNRYVWLLASYADQLVRLHLESEAQCPPLQTRHQYTCSDANGATRVIATTSESAFRNLKELKITDPTQNFLFLSETPALQQFSVVNMESYPYFELEDVTIFIDKCANTLKTLVLNYPWNPMVSWEVYKNCDEGHGPLFLPTSQTVLPRLKTLTVHYPDTDVSEIVLSEFLAKFPALEKLQLLHFQLHRFDFGIQILDLDHLQIVNNEAVEVANENIQLADEIGALKERLPPLFEHLSGILKSKRVAEDVLSRLEVHPDDGAAIAEERQLETEIERLEHAVTVTRTERATIFRRLAALGVNTRKVMVEQLVERRGYWNTCPRLRILSVSNGEKPVGDVCVIQRTDYA